jgi:hypothetical protein
MQGFGNDVSLAEAACVWEQLVQALPPVLGRVVGCYAGFPNPALQQRFGMSSPAWGVMFACCPCWLGRARLYAADFTATCLVALSHASALPAYVWRN